ncbi:biotin--protein ligase 1, chloroplastic-like isoform X3 [Hibiscus syriacus]|uniref:biotin--protein ligase 1, chloroplastic-like isoform X3 n=1 Tax=Hibiscus syriacus TaxID=106335 RepID=UPI00192125C6|nr:biotin--protein ligase 1, chloroplastic-like isoform X3 [Hibiscus syriacus]
MLVQSSRFGFLFPAIQKRIPSSLSIFVASSAMDTASPSALFLCGKSSAETEIAKSLKINDVLNLPNAVGAVCVADTQFKGRGRSKNSWESPRGCLMFSFTLQMDDGKIVPLVQYVVSLAVTEAIKDVCDRNGFPCIDVRIKWPNDLYLNGLKVGGILCTSTYKSKKFNVSSGIGLNVGNEKPTTCLNTVLKELSASSNEFRREDVMAAFFNKFEMLYDIFINQGESIFWCSLQCPGFQTLEELYYRTWLHSGQRAIVQEKNENNVVENVVTVQGLTSSGYLLAIGDDNQMCELHPDGNSFDFFKGLVRRKLE